jgi:ribosomal protein S18 acetylase RimI-like enzyme
MRRIEIRPFRIEDADTVLELWQSVGMTRPGGNPRADIRKKLRHSPESFFVGLHEGRVVATVMAGYDGHRGWVYSLAVRPELQRRGIGRAMVEAAETWLRGQGCGRVKLQVERDPGEAVGFYRKLGYEVQDLVSMRKTFKTTDS